MATDAGPEVEAVDERNAGHRAGARVGARGSCVAAGDLGVQFLTLYAFSLGELEPTPKAEVERADVACSSTTSKSRDRRGDGEGHSRALDRSSRPAAPLDVREAVEKAVEQTAGQHGR